MLWDLNIHETISCFFLGSTCSLLLFMVFNRVLEISKLNSKWRLFVIGPVLLVWIFLLLLKKKKRIFFEFTLIFSQLPVPKLQHVHSPRGSKNKNLFEFFGRFLQISWTMVLKLYDLRTQILSPMIVGHFIIQ